MKVTSYILIAEGNVPSLNKRVSELLKEGYQPFGNPFAHESSDKETLICQAMVRQAN